jgi:hypothetical protein
MISVDREKRCERGLGDAEESCRDGLAGEAATAAGEADVEATGADLPAVCEVAAGGSIVLTVG